MRAVITALVDLVVPPTCGACGGPTPDPGAFCAPCAALIPPLVSAPRVPAPLRSATTRASFEGLVQRLVQDLKYERDLPLARPLSRLLAEACPRLPAVPDLVVPVPLHPDRMRERGFDQAWLLAEAVAAELDVPRAEALRRVAARPPQVGLPLDARQDNVRGIFAPNPGVEVSGQVVLLVDDVVTTGSTAAEAARVLLEAGAAGVDLLTLAWAERGDALR